MPDRPTSGACLATPAGTVTTTIAADATPTFGIFVTGSAAVGDLPGVNRAFVTFMDASGVCGETSVVARTQCRRKRVKRADVAIGGWRPLGGGYEARHLTHRGDRLRLQVGFFV